MTLSSFPKSKIHKDYLSQLKIWIWEAGIQLGFEDVACRIEAYLDLDNVRVYFKEGRTSDLLFIIHRLQQIISKIQKDNSNSVEYLDQLIGIATQLLQDPHFHSENEFIRSLVCFYHSAVLMRLISTGSLFENDLFLSDFSNQDQWDKIKQLLGFKDDFYRSDFVKVSNVSGECLKAILKEKLTEKDIRVSYQTLRNRAKNLCKELRNLLRPPALVQYCQKGTLKELTTHGSAEYNSILVRNIKNNIVTADCLHSIIDELVNFSSQSSSSSQETFHELEMRRKGSRALKVRCERYLFPKPNSKKQCQPCKELPINKCDIIVLKGVYWEILNKNKSCVPFLSSKEILTVKKVNLSPSDENCLIQLSNRKKKVEKEKNVVESLSAEIKNLEKLVETVDKLSIELRTKCGELKEQQNRFLMSKENIPLKNSGKSLTKFVSNSHDSKEEFDSLDVHLKSRCVANILETEHESVPIVTSESDQNGFDSPPNSGDERSMPDLTCYAPSSSKSGANVNSFSNLSRSTMPNLTLYGIRPLKMNPVVELTPLSPTTVNKYTHISSADSSDYEIFSNSRKRKFKHVESSYRNKKILTREQRSSTENDKGNLSKIDLPVTNAHCTMEESAVILESNLSPSPSEESQSIDSIPSPKRKYARPSTSAVSGSKTRGRESSNKEKTGESRSKNLDTNVNPKNSLEDFEIDRCNKNKSAITKAKKTKKSQPKLKKKSARSLEVKRREWKKKIFSSSSSSSSEELFSSGKSKDSFSSPRKISSDNSSLSPSKFSDDASCHDSLSSEFFSIRTKPNLQATTSPSETCRFESPSEGKRIKLNNRSKRQSIESVQSGFVTAVESPQSSPLRGDSVFRPVTPIEVIDVDERDDTEMDEDVTLKDSSPEWVKSSQVKTLNSVHNVQKCCVLLRLKKISSRPLASHIYI